MVPVASCLHAPCYLAQARRRKHADALATPTTYPNSCNPTVLVACRGRSFGSTSSSCHHASVGCAAKACQRRALPLSSGLRCWWSQVLAGLFQSTGWPSVVSIVANWSGKGKRGLVMGIWNANTSVGNILGTVLSASLLSQVSWAEGRLTAACRSQHAGGTGRCLNKSRQGQPTWRSSLWTASADEMRAPPPA